MENLTLDKLGVDINEKQVWENTDLPDDDEIEKDIAVEIKKQEELVKTRVDISNATYEGKPIAPYNINPKYCPYVKDVPFASKPYGPRTPLFNNVPKKNNEKNNKFSLTGFFRKIIK